MESFKLKNYTTKVPWRRTVGEIEIMLGEFGASQIAKHFFEDGRLRSLIFQIEDKVYQLPANSDGVRVAMFGNDAGYQKQLEQAERVAWRLVKDWIHAQLSMVYSNQAKPDQIMLPYLWDGEKTLYEAIEAGQVKLPQLEDQIGKARRG